MADKQPTEASVDALKEALRTKGEWASIMRLLQMSLNESGWEDRVKDKAKEEARVMQPLDLKTLLASITPQAKSMVAPEIRKDVEARIRAFLEANPIDA